MPNTPKYANALQAKCPECGRVFDLTNAVDVSEWFHGHDCEDNETGGLS